MLLLGCWVAVHLSPPTFSPLGAMGTACVSHSWIFVGEDLGGGGGRKRVLPNG